jgi:hypothetical protein
MSFSHTLSATDSLAALLEKSPSLLWRGRDSAPLRTRSTGFAALDNLLPGRGWPIGALTELLPVCTGLGEVSICMPALANLCREKRYVAFVSPPHIPYAPSLVNAGVSLRSVVWIECGSDEDARWSAEQLLREGQAGAVLLWSSTNQEQPLRRLQLAAEAGGALAFVYRSAQMRHQPSPAALRIELTSDTNGTRANVLKLRGGRPGSVLLAPPSLFT